MPKGIYRRASRELKVALRQVQREADSELNALEKNLISEMEKVLADPSASVRDKYNATVTIRQVRDEARSRYRRAKALAEIGPAPTREDFPTGYDEALAAYHDAIEKSVVSDVLSDAGSSTKQLAEARKQLEEIKKRELQRGVRGSIRHRENQETDEERQRKAAFFAEADTENVGEETI